MHQDAEHKKQLAAEMVLDSESLTDDLEDAAAKRLLDWGLAQAEHMATQATDQDLDRSVSGIRRLIKRVNNLVADRAVLTDDELAAELSDLATLAGQTIGLQIQAIGQALLADREGLDDVALVERITALLTPAEPDTEEPIA
jgi:hypothetical protein